MFTTAPTVAQLFIWTCFSKCTLERSRKEIQRNAKKREAQKIKTP